MHESRLGDEIDDFCIKCKRLTNHAIVSLLNAHAAKVRCRTCYHDHDFRNGEPMPSKKDLKKQQLFEQVLAGNAAMPLDGVVEMPANGAESAAVAVETAVVEAVADEPVPSKKARKTAKS